MRDEVVKLLEDARAGQDADSGRHGALKDALALLRGQKKADKS